jgi:hypothetical protein
VPLLGGLRGFSFKKGMRESTSNTPPWGRKAELVDLIELLAEESIGLVWKNGI